MANECTQLTANILAVERASHIEVWRASALARSAFIRDQALDPQRSADTKRLYRAYAQVYSQGGEDGYVAEIFARIKPASRTFLEIGVGNGQQNTSRLLLEQGWRGTWIEGDPVAADAASKTFADYISSGALCVISSMAQPVSINQLLDSVRAPLDVDYLSVDIDQHTGHIWRALNRRARVACIEYNASLPASVALEVPYVENALWDGSNFFGASLKTLEIVGRGKTMSLVGCDPPGVNAYFVADHDLGNRFSAPYSAENHYELPRYELLVHTGHPPSPTSRCWRLAEDGLDGGAV